MNATFWLVVVVVVSSDSSLIKRKEKKSISCNDAADADEDDMEKINDFHLGLDVSQAEIKVEKSATNETVDVDVAQLAWPAWSGLIKPI